MKPYAYYILPKKKRICSYFSDLGIHNLSILLFTIYYFSQHHLFRHLTLTFSIAEVSPLKILSPDIQYRRL